MFKSLLRVRKYLVFLQTLHVKFSLSRDWASSSDVVTENNPTLLLSLSSHVCLRLEILRKHVVVIGHYRCNKSISKLNIKSTVVIENNCSLSVSWSMHASLRLLNPSKPGIVHWYSSSVYLNIYLNMISGAFFAAPMLTLTEQKLQNQHVDPIFDFAGTSTFDKSATGAFEVCLNGCWVIELDENGKVRHQKMSDAQ